MRRTTVWISLMSLSLLAAGAAPALAQTASAPSGTAAPTAAPKPAPPAKSLTAVGHVKSVSADNLVILVGKAQKEETFVLEPTTKITKSGKTIPATEVTANDMVRVSYLETEGKMMAKTVTVRTARVATKPVPSSQPAGQPKTP